MTSRRFRVLCSWTAGLLILAPCIPRSLASQEESAGLSMSLVSLRQIAVDFDTGRNLIYCYYGLPSTSGPLIRVDSMQVVSSPSECDGVGIGFISRIADRPMIEEMLRGVLLSHPAFRIVSAFYATEDIDVAGKSYHAARALSVLRSRPLRAAAMFGS